MGLIGQLLTVAEASNLMFQRKCLFKIFATILLCSFSTSQDAVMGDNPNINKEADEVISKYKGYGLWVGLPLGLLLGVLISGPYFHTWPLSMTACVLLGFTVGGGIIGYCADHIAFASTTTGFGSLQNIFSWGDGHGHGSVGLDSSDHGGGGGGGDCGGDGGGH